MFESLSTLVDFSLVVWQKHQGLVIIGYNFSDSLQRCLRGGCEEEREVGAGSDGGALFDAGA